MLCYRVEKNWSAGYPPKGGFYFPLTQLENKLKRQIPDDYKKFLFEIEDYKVNKFQIVNLYSLINIRSIKLIKKYGKFQSEIAVMMDGFDNGGFEGSLAVYCDNSGRLKKQSAATWDT